MAAIIVGFLSAIKALNLIVCLAAGRGRCLLLLCSFLMRSEGFAGVWLFEGHIALGLDTVVQRSYFAPLKRVWLYQCYHVNGKRCGESAQLLTGLRGEVDQS
jgi:hypothetical protein